MKLTVITILCLVACGGEPEPEYPTVGEICDGVAGEWCGRQAACGAGFPECVEVFVYGCCENARICGDEQQEIDSASLNDCLDDISILSCGDVEVGTLPRSCG